MSAGLSSAIATSARQSLLPLGLVRHRRSRTWLDDHSWWLLAVEFQPAVSGRFYLNIAENHLFVPHGHLVLEDMERPLGGAWTGGHDEDSIHKAMDAAVEAIIARRVRHGEGRAALDRLLTRDDLIAGVAAALLGDEVTARARLQGDVHPAYRQVAAQYLTALEHGTALQLAATMTNESRAQLQLNPATLPNWGL